MTIRKLLLASTCALTLASCATEMPIQQLTADDLLTAPFSLSASQPFDVDAFLSALSTDVRPSYSAATFDSVSGAMVIDDLAISLGDHSGAMLNIAELKVWSPDIAAMQAVFDGVADSPEIATLFERVAMSGVSISGLQKDAGAQSAAFNIDKVVIDGLAASDFALPVNPSAPEGSQFVRQFAGMAASIAMEAAAFEGLEISLNDNSGNEVLYTMGQVFVRAYDQGRIDYYSARDSHYETSTLGVPLGAGPKEVSYEPGDNINKRPPEFGKILQPQIRETFKSALKNPVATLAQTYGGMSSSQTTEFVEWRDYDISGVLPYLVAWRLPSITQTNLLSLGAGTVTNNQQSIDGKPFYSVARSEIDASDFYWLIPSRLTQQDFGGQLNFGAIMDIYQAQGVNTPQFTQARNAIAALGLGVVDYDAQTGWGWDGAIGDIKVFSNTQISTFADIGYNIELGGPSLRGWRNAMSGTGSTDKATLPLEDMSIQQLSFSIRDDQMLDKLFAFAAQEMGGSADDLRQSAPAMIRLSGAQLTQMNPRFSAYVDAFADFISEGGSIKISVQPDNPVPFSALQSGAVTPQTLPDILNLSVVHTDR